MLRYDKGLLVICAVLFGAMVSISDAQTNSSGDPLPTRMDNASGTVSTQKANVSQVDKTVVSKPLQIETASVAYLGQISGNDVNLRSGPGAAYYDILKLVKGTAIVVVEEQKGNSNWAKILPVEGCFSYISKQYVNVRTIDVAIEATDEQEEQSETKKIGVVTGNNVLVRAGSRIVPPINARQVQCKLNYGAKVEIIGERDNFYKIIPPANCYFWVSLDYVQKVKALTKEDMKDFIGAKLTTITVSDIEIVPVDNKILNSQYQTYRNLVKMLSEETKMPLGQRNVAELKEQFANLLKNAESESLKSACKAYVLRIEAQESAQKDYFQSIDDTKKLRDALEKLDEMARKIKLESGISADGQQRVVKGKVTRSYVFDKSAQTRRFKIVDADNLFVCYAVAANANVDLLVYLDKVVSLTGVANYDATADADLLTVTAINGEQTGQPEEKKETEAVEDK
ncbi:MAG: hypothetical protein JEZ07_16930 [Phycisphaerae bacterium]|nr:hypothetical protein [Phycisphaerae bacterium]